jgi:hypothetical protein
VTPETLPAPAIGIITQKITTATKAIGTVAASNAEVDHRGAMIGVMSRADIAATMDGGAVDAPSDASEMRSVRAVPACQRRFENHMLKVSNTISYWPVPA